MALLRNVTTGAIVATRVERAERWLERAVGFLGRPRIRPDEGLWLTSCSAIHTIGMRAPLDVIFVDAGNRVVRLCCDVPAWRWAIGNWKARAVIELGAGALREVDILLGDRLELVAAQAYRSEQPSFRERLGGSGASIRRRAENASVPAFSCVT